MSTTLIIGNKNYSSWSLRGWLLCTRSGIEFSESLIPLHQAGSSEAKRDKSPSGLVPALHVDGTVVWDSLAIAEYLAEQFPDAQMWPKDVRKRAIARSVTCEMHSGFAALRNQMPMNIRAMYTDTTIDAALAADIDRIAMLWRECRANYGQGGEFLFGNWSIVDAFFTPVAFRFQTYAVELGATESAYGQALRSTPEAQAWAAAAKAEEHTIPAYDR